VAGAHAVSTRRRHRLCDAVPFQLLRLSLLGALLRHKSLVCLCWGSGPPLLKPLLLCVHALARRKREKVLLWQARGVSLQPPHGTRVAPSHHKALPRVLTPLAVECAVLRCINCAISQGWPLCTVPVFPWFF